MPKTLHLNEDDLQMFIRGQLDLGSADAMDDHLRECPGCQGRLAHNARFIARCDDTTGTCEPYKGAEKRAEPRFRTEDWGLLRSVAPLSFERFAVRIVDVSRSGLGIILTGCLSRGTLVQIRIGKTVVLGEVRYSRPHGHEFQTGLRLQDVRRADEPNSLTRATS